MATSPRYSYAAFAGAVVGLSAVLFVACATPKTTAQHTTQPAPSLQYPATTRGRNYLGFRVAKTLETDSGR